MARSGFHRDLLARAAAAAEKAGRVWLALEWLEQAARLRVDQAKTLRTYRRLLCHVADAPSEDNPDRALVLIISCTPNLDRAERLAAVAATATGDRPMIVRGAPGAARFGLTRKEDFDLLEAPCGDGYQDLPEKILAALRYVDALTVRPGVLKLDDDVLIEDPARFAALLRDLSGAGDDYVGQGARFADLLYHHGRPDCDPAALKRAVHRSVDYAVGGAGYYLTRRSLGALFRGGLQTGFGSAEAGPVYEDVFVGELLDEAGIGLTERELLWRGGYSTDNFELRGLIAAVEKYIS